MTGVGREFLGNFKCYKKGNTKSFIIGNAIGDTNGNQKNFKFSELFLGKSIIKLNKLIGLSHLLRIKKIVIFNLFLN